MTEGKKAEEVVKECIKNWGMANRDVDRNLGGTLTALSPAVRLISINYFGPIFGMELEDSDIGKHLFILNYTGPFMIEKSYGKEWINQESWISQT